MVIIKIDTKNQEILQQLAQTVEVLIRSFVVDSLLSPNRIHKLDKFSNAMNQSDQKRNTAEMYGMSGMSGMKNYSG